jgi:tetratricopeptide (TPR) repeat protein
MPTWDDNEYVTANPIIQNLNLQSVKQMFTRQVNGTYVPLPLLTYSIEYSLFGLHPFPYHLTNLILHLLCTLLVFRLFRMLKINILYAAFGAVLFGIHPMRVESVAWITERKDVLYSVFYLAAIVTHVKFIQSEKNVKFYRLTLLFFFLALLSKIEAVTLPLSLLLIDYFMERPLKFKLLIEKIPHFLLSLFFGCAGIFILHRTGVLRISTGPGFTDRLFYGFFSLNVYIVKFIFPYLQSAVYPYPVAPGNTLPLFYYLNPLLSAGIIFMVYKTARYTRTVVFGTLFFLVNVIFLLQILAAGNAFLADRFTYIAYTGLIFILVWALDELVSKKKRWKQFVLSGMVGYILVFMVMTYNRCEIWKDGETLWTDVIEKFPDQNIAAYSNRGIAYTSSGQWDNAMADFSKAMTIDPKYPVSYANRGIVYGNLGKEEDAISDFTKAIEIDPNYTLAYHNRGVAYGDLGQFDKAVKDLLHAIRLDAKYISAYTNLSIIYCHKNHVDSAIGICQEGLKKNPLSATLQASLGNCYLEKGDISRSMDHYKKCLETNERDIGALLGMAAASFLNKEIPYANGYINQAQSIAPALNEGMDGVAKLEAAGYSFSAKEKEILARLFEEMK